LIKKSPEEMEYQKEPVEEHQTAPHMMPSRYSNDPADHPYAWLP
jgi:hypothetical protein